MPNVRGGCHCGNIQAELVLSRDTSTYDPRVCDCDFCTKHGAAYVSDPRGTLVIRINDESELGRYRQGSGTAEMLVCRRCGVLVGAVCRIDAKTYATVNARVIDGDAAFGAPRTVSPKKLSRDDKTARWKDIWFSDVRIDV